MPEPVKVDIPHRLGREAAKARLGGGIGKLAGMIPGAAATAHHWEGDTLHFTVSALGQTIASKCEVFDNHVHAEVDLPPMLALFAGKVRDKLMNVAPKLLK